LPVALAVLLAGCSSEHEGEHAAENTALVTAIRNGRARERAQAALKLWNTTHKVDPALQALLDDAASKSDQRRRAAALYLPRAQEIPEDVIDWVMNARFGWAMLATLGAIGPQAKKSLPTVRAALKSADPTIRNTAAWALFRIGGHVDKPVRLLMAELISAPVGARPGIADTLLEIGKAQPDRFKRLLSELVGDPKYAQVAADLLASLPR